jgi:hypothetical protein
MSVEVEVQMFSVSGTNGKINIDSTSPKMTVVKERVGRCNDSRPQSALAGTRNIRVS